MADDYVPKEFYQFVDPDLIYKFTLPAYDIQKDGDFMRKKKKLFEASAASRFAIGCQIHDKTPYVLRLIPEQNDHDFELKAGNLAMTFQLTETMEAERKRDDEYKARQKGELRFREYRPQRNQEQYVDWVVASVENKVAKNYPDKPHLLIHLNFNVCDADFQSLQEQINRVSGIGKFSSIWGLMTTSLNVHETTFGRFYPQPHGWHTIDCEQKILKE